MNNKEYIPKKIAAMEIVKEVRTIKIVCLTACVSMVIVLLVSLLHIITATIIALFLSFGFGFFLLQAQNKEKYLQQSYGLHGVKSRDPNFKEYNKKEKTMNLLDEAFK